MIIVTVGCIHDDDELMTLTSFKEIGIQKQVRDQVTKNPHTKFFVGNTANTNTNTSTNTNTKTSTAKLLVGYASSVQ